MVLKRSVFVAICLLTLALTACQSSPTSVAGTTGTTETTASPTATPTATTTPPTTTESPVFYSEPRGNSWVQAFGPYVYYVANGVLSRMRENGTGYEFPLETNYIDGVRLINDNKQLYCYYDRSYSIIAKDGAITQLIPECAPPVGFVDQQFFYLADTHALHWPYHYLRKMNVTTRVDSLVSKIPARQVIGDQGYLYINYDLFDEAANKSSSRLVKRLPDGGDEVTIDIGVISELMTCGRYLIYRKDIEKVRGQMWSYHMDTGTRQLLLDTGKDEKLNGQLEFAGSWQDFAYCYIRKGGIEDMLLCIKPDGSALYETIWDGERDRGAILGVDLEHDWLYFGKRQAFGDVVYGVSRYAMRSYRCHLDRSDIMKFCDRTAFEPVTIGDFIYFSSADEDFINVALRRYNTQAGTIEDLPNGLLPNQIWTTH